MVEFAGMSGLSLQPVQLIQAERLTISVVTSIVTVELTALRGKMTDLARWGLRPSVWEKAGCRFPRQNIGIPAFKHHQLKCDNEFDN